MKTRWLAWLIVSTLLMLASQPVLAGEGDRFSDINLTEANQVDLPQIAAPSGNPLNNRGWIYVKDDAGTTKLYYEDDAGTVTDLTAAGSVTWDAIGDAAAGGTILFGAGEEAIMSSADTTEAMFEFRGTGNFGNFPIVKISQMTGNPTDGTVLEVVSADTDADALLVTANAINSLLVGGNGDVTIIGGGGVINYTDFDVSADGAIVLANDDGGTMITLSPSAAATGIDATAAAIGTALTVGANDIVGTTGLINYTNFDVDASGNVVTSGNVTCAALTATSVKQDALIPASAAPTTITLDGAGAGGVTIGGTSTGTVTLGGGSTLVNLPAATDLTLVQGVLSLTDTANSPIFSATNNTLTTQNLVSLTANALTSGKGLSVVSSGAVVTGDMVYAQAADGAGFTGNYFRAYDGAADDFKVARYGKTTIAGNASTDVLIVTTGDVQIDDGLLDVATDEDDSSKIARNQGVTTKPVFEVEETAAAADSPALLIDQNATAAGAYALEIDSEGGPGIHFANLVAAGPGIIFDVADNYTARLIYGDLGPWLGTTGEGAIQLYTDVAPTAPAGMLMRLVQNGTGQHLAAINGSVLYLADAAAAPGAGTSYVMSIQATNIEALHVDSGTAVFDETASFVTGLTAATVQVDALLDVNEDVDIDFDAADEEMTISNSAEYAADGAQVTIENTDADITGGNGYLLRLRYTDDGQANADYMVLEDNNGDDKVTIANEGDIVTEGTLTVNGAQIIGDGATEVVGVRRDVVDCGAGTPYAVTAAMSNTLFTNSQACEFDLPADPTGLTYTFCVDNASNLDLDPAAGDLVNYAGAIADDLIRSATVGDCISIAGVSASQWKVTAVVAGDGSFADEIWTDVP